ncbi:MAG: NAD(P)-binding domain-containing protein, partial [Pseudolabrys sp.]
MRGRSSMLVDRRLLLGAASFAAITTILQPTRLFAQGSSPTRIGIIGSGNIGGTIGGLWVKKGHSVFFSSRHPDELKDMVAKLGSLAQAGTVEQAVAFGDVLFIA